MRHFKNRFFLSFLLVLLQQPRVSVAFDQKGPLKDLVCSNNGDCSSKFPNCATGFCRKPCTGNSDCAATTDFPFCIKNYCRGCQSNKDCTLPGNEHCVNNDCRNCVDHSDCPYPEYRPFCNDNNCNECRTDTDCVNAPLGKKFCIQLGNLQRNCLYCRTNDHCAWDHVCTPGGGYCSCDFSTRNCCESNNAGCGGRTPVCRNNKCICPPGSICTEDQGSICFSAVDTVQKENGETLLMKDLQVGDVVLVEFDHASNRSIYEPVYGFAHWDPHDRKEYLKIETSVASSSALHGYPQEPLEISPDHLLYTFGNKHPVPAASLKIGDELAGHIHVLKISTIYREDGLYAPLTPSGKIVVNGISASNYIALWGEGEYLKVNNKEGWTFPFLSQHDVIHMWMSPYRVVCLHLAPGFCAIPDGATTMPLWVKWGLQLASYVERYGLMAQLVMVAVALAVFIPLYCLEWLIGSSFALLMVSSVAVCYALTVAVRSPYVNWPCMVSLESLDTLVDRINAYLFPGSPCSQG
jgi:hypothetical protein